jgi:hypothetical protein
MLTRPARDVAPDQVVAAVEHGMKLTGYNEFSLLSLSCSDYLALPSVGLQIKNELGDEQVSLSLPSQRIDRWARLGGLEAGLGHWNPARQQHGARKVRAARSSPRLSCPTRNHQV